ncbi:MAG TPA: EscU/YscU/HrcU family type III secretion system export apparatus switch protein, partial [Candidatus Methylacidiphilales bacterium]|nr:EscU/YscU/HrcU family type III secretion system export apparatus switch protein [Candidatus Methylacidiphilales bacterium]
GMLIEYLRTLMANSFLQISHPSTELASEQVGSVFHSGLWLWIALFVAALALAVFVSQAVQVGLNFADDAFAFKFEKLNPVAGFQNIFSVNKLTVSGQNAVKLVVIASFAWMAMKDIQDSAVFQRPVSIEELGAAYVTVAWSFGWRIVAALVALALVDVIWQRWKFNQDHMMTYEEMKEERRSQEMSPEFIKKRRMTHRKVSMRRMLENLKDATIVVTNPTHYAVALRYRRGIDEVPVVLAKGIRKSALRIKEAAYELRIPVRENVPLARGLYKYGRVDQPIPGIFYQAVAIVLAALFKQGFATTGDPNPFMTKAELNEIMDQDND